MSSGSRVDALCVGAAKLAVSLGVLALGFSAVSDDDYARVGIAQRFAETPHLDPSGTSWLPLPFWAYGAALRAFGTGLGVARATALVLSAAGMMALWTAARWVGASRAGAVLAALVAAAFPWSAWLGAATVPEVPAAGLIVLGLAALAKHEPRVRLLGAAALAAACLCRYEAWPVAAAFALFSAGDAYRARSSVHALAATIAISTMLFWTAHGALAHGDPLFFVRRVTAYRDALGGGAPFARRAAGPVIALFGEAPEISVSALVTLALARPVRTLARPAIAASSLLAFLVVGEIGGGAPTHHAARAILPIWYLGAVAIGEAAGRLASSAVLQRAAFTVPLALVTLAIVTRAPFPRDFVDRRDALDIGQRASSLSAPGLFIDTADYGYLAVAAAFGRASLAEPFDDRDPRHGVRPDPFLSPTTLRARVRARPAAWLVVTRAHRAVAAALGPVRADNAKFALIEPTGAAEP